MQRISRFMVHFWIALFTVAVVTPAHPAAAAGLPTVSVTAELANASKVGPQPGVFKFTRSGGDLSTSLTVAFTLGGTATRNADYLIASKGADNLTLTFDPGAETARLAIVPRNALAPSTQSSTSVIVTLAAGASYAVGAPASATVTIAEYFYPGLQGVWIPREADSLGLVATNPEIRYLDAHVQNGFLNLRLLLEAAATAPLTTVAYNVAIFLDTNPAVPGDARLGDVSGQKYRVDASVQGFTGMVGIPGMFNAQYTLRDLASAPQCPVGPLTCDALQNGNPVLVAQPAGTDAAGQTLTISIPLGAIGNPAAADLFAVAHVGGANIVAPGAGSRAPLYGALDTASGQTVVRHPGITEHATLSRITPPAADRQLHVQSGEFWVLADQFLMQFTYNGAFNPQDLVHFPGPTGELTVDSDRNLETGEFFMGDDIPTWGGDVKLAYNFGSVQAQASYILLMNDGGGTSAVFGQGINDGQWRAVGPVPGNPLTSTLRLAGSLSLFDARSDTQRMLPGPSGAEKLTRVAADGRMYLETDAGATSLTTDVLPQVTLGNGATVHGALDLSTAHTIAPLEWDANRTTWKSTDPSALVFGGVQKYTRIDGEVLGGNLVIQGTLNSWTNTEVGNIFHVNVHSRSNETTGLWPSPAGSSMPVDAVYQLDSQDFGGAPAYIGSLRDAAGVRTLTSASLNAHPNFAIGQPASFIVTIPLAALGQPLASQAQVLLEAGTTDAAMIGSLIRSDLAPQSGPLAIALSPLPTTSRAP